MRRKAWLVMPASFHPDQAKIDGNAGNDIYDILLALIRHRARRFLQLLSINEPAPDINDAVAFDARFIYTGHIKEASLEQLSITSATVGDN